MLTAIIVLTALGIILVFAETILPGGILGLVGGVCLLIAVVLSYIEFGAARGNLMLVGIMAVSLLAFFVGIKVFPESPLGKKLTLQTEIDEEDRPSLVGLRGTTLTSLRPTGKALIGGNRLDVVAQGGSIEKDQPIEVLEADGMRTIVRQIS